MRRFRRRGGVEFGEGGGFGAQKEGLENGLVGREATGEKRLCEKQGYARDSERRNR